MGSDVDSDAAYIASPIAILIVIPISPVHPVTEKTPKSKSPHVEFNCKDNAQKIRTTSSWSTDNLIHPQFQYGSLDLENDVDLRVASAKAQPKKRRKPHFNIFLPSIECLTPKTPIIQNSTS